MSHIRERLEQLILQAGWSSEDRRWLLNFLDSGDTDLLRTLLNDRFMEELNRSETTDNQRAKEILAQLHARIKQEKETARSTNFFVRKGVAAAFVFIFFIVGGYYLLEPEQSTNPQARIRTAPSKTEKKDLPPGGDKAVLTLADGSIVILDEASEGSIARQSAVDIRKLSQGALVYQGGMPSNEIVYNSISTPKGGKFQITLSDGTKVWLNAASSLRFPVQFVGGERRVELIGEGYFEVAENPLKPFVVDVAGREDVLVLGTHFNINSYGDEESINTTLLKGSVHVRSKASPVGRRLVPGQQHLLFSEGRYRIRNDVDMEKTIAWKNDKFDFGESMELKSVMRQIERWYNVEIEYEGDVSSIELSGSISRNVSAKKVFEMLELTGVASFRIREGKVLVSAKK